MKKPVKGKQKQVKHRNARKRFVTKAERAARRNRWRIKLVEKANKQRKEAEELMGLVNEYNEALAQAQAQIVEDEDREQTDDALFDNEEPEKE